MALPYNQVRAITHDLIKDQLTMGVFKSSKFTERILEKSELEDGGNKIILPLASVDDTSSNGAFYSPRDALNLNEVDHISASEHDWKYLQETITIYKADIAKNAGRLGVLKLIGSKVKVAEKSMRQRLIKGVLSDGTVSTGALDADQFIGLNAIIASSGTYGGIAPADLASWVANVLDNGGSTRALTLDLMNQAVDGATESGIGGPSLGIMDNAVFSVFKGLLDANQRTTRENSLGGQGHKGQSLVYMGIDHLVENNMPESGSGLGVIFYVDEDHAKLCIQKDNNMRRQSIQDLETSDAMLERIFLYSAYVASERKFHARINDITK